ncbi:MAG: nucleoside 2-deoxyribosyltransferase [Xanthobacteraceae bacterium]|nr:nucleoside 2-deoxyribosyltransferase [Xanthobacteraceae bacterium]
MKVYLAGPDVFLPDAIAVGRRKRDICAAHGLVGLFPLDGEVAALGLDASMEIFQANTELMAQSDAIIANLTPFRGPSADAGTVYELGFMAGQRKFCTGYSNIPGVYLDRVAARPQGGASPLYDSDGLVVEDFKLADNLMIVHALDLYGHALIVPEQPPDDVWHDLTVFEACVRIVAERA